jgi:hypothetical protein
MAHWAELDENNVVLRVTVGSNDEPDEGYGWLIANFGGRWVQTSYNGNIRRRFAGIGMNYDEERDAFITQQPFPSWSLDDNHDWQPPAPRPEEGRWRWDEDALAWIEVAK